jgi:hypothetical protein
LSFPKHVALKAKPPLWQITFDVVGAIVFAVVMDLFAIVDAIVVVVIIIL